MSEDAKNIQEPETDEASTGQVNDEDIASTQSNKEKSPKKKAAKSKTPLRVRVGTLAEAKATEEGVADITPDRYIYCDFANIAEEEYDVDYELEQDGLNRALDEATGMAAAQLQQIEQFPPGMVSASKLIRASGWVRSQRFPVKLYALLSQPQLAHIITWMPHGRSWKVLQPKLFETAILPVFFESDNYHSFNRVINAWSFRRKSSGPDRGSYFHELFLRGKPHLQKYMRRLPRTHKKLAMAKDEEPDFFELESTSPLPTLEDSRYHLESKKMKRLQEHYEKGGSLPTSSMALNRSGAGTSLMNDAKREAVSGVARSFLPTASLPGYGNIQSAQEGDRMDGERFAAGGGGALLGASPTSGFMAQNPLLGQADLLEQERYRLMVDEQALYQRQLSMMQGLPYGAMNPMGASGPYSMGASGFNPYFQPPP